MKCAKCGASVMQVPLERINAYGEMGIWWCKGCIKKYEPELFKNIEDDETPPEKFLKKLFYPHKIKHT